MNIPYKRLAPADLNVIIEQAQAGSVEARNRVILHMMRLVIRKATDAARRAGRMSELDDMVQAAVMGCSPTSMGGLVRAIADFDTHRGIRFSTYAAMWIRAALRDVLSDNLISGRGSQSRPARIRRTAAMMHSQSGNRPTAEDVHAELAAAGATSQPQLAAIRRALEAPIRVDSFDPSSDVRGLSEDRDESGTRVTDRTTRRAIAESCVVDECDVADALDLESALQRQAEVMLQLTPIEQQILRARFGLGAGAREPDEQTLQQIGSAIGKSRERVRQIEARALDKLRAALRSLAA